MQELRILLDGVLQQQDPKARKAAFETYRKQRYAKGLENQVAIDKDLLRYVLSLPAESVIRLPWNFFFEVIIVCVSNVHRTETADLCKQFTSIAFSYDDATEVLLATVLLYEKTLSNERRVSQMTSVFSGILGKLLFDRIEKINLDSIESTRAAMVHCVYAVCWKNGYGVEANPSKALLHWEAALDKDDQFTFAQLGFGMSFDSLPASQNGLRYITLAADQGNPIAQNILGTHYLEIADDEATRKKAFGLFCKAAMQGYVIAQFHVAHCCEWGLGVRTDQGEALIWCARAAAHRYAAALYTMGRYYESQIGVTKDTSKSIKFYEAAAAEGSADGSYRLGYFYDKGISVPINKRNALSHYRQAAMSGHVQAQYALGILLLDTYDINNGIEWITKAALEDFAIAQYALGMFYEEGELVNGDFDQAVYWYLKAAKKNHQSAETALARILFEGKGTRGNEEGVFKWCLQSSHKGNTRAMFYLAYCYEKGIGIAENKQDARRWYVQTMLKTDAGDPLHMRAQFFIRLLDMGLRLRSGISDSELNQIEALVSKDDREARLDLAQKLMNGIGVEKDRAKAQEILGELRKQPYAGPRIVYSSNRQPDRGIEQHSALPTPPSTWGGLGDIRNLASSSEQPRSDGKGSHNIVARSRGGNSQRKRPRSTR